MSSRDRASAMRNDLGELIVRARAPVAEARAASEINREVRATAAALAGDFIAIASRVRDAG